MTGRNVLVAGAGGFIGGHLVQRLLDDGEFVVGVDIKPFDQWWQPPRTSSMFGNVRDLSYSTHAREVFRGATFDEVYMLAADMGGMGFIANHKVECMRSVLTSTHMIEAAAVHQAGGYFYSSSACVYAEQFQSQALNPPLREEDAYPAMPEDGYGWEKLFSERMCMHYQEENRLYTRVARYHNVYGPHGTWDGGREKAPAALCRKIAQAIMHENQTIQVWGDGKQTRSFMYIDDCVEGTLRIMRGSCPDPVNLGSDELVTIDELAHMIMVIAGVEMEIHHVEGPQGVRGRCSDNTLIRERYGWEPSISLMDGLEKTYAWIYDQVKRRV